MSLKQTFEQYTQVIQEGALEALFKTVTDNNIIHLIGTTDQIMKTWQQYHDFHAEWFKESNWDITFELMVKTIPGTL